MPVAADSAPTIPAIPYLLLPVPDTDFREYLEEAVSLADSFPEIITSIDADLDRHAKQKKALRLADQTKASRLKAAAKASSEGSPQHLEEPRPRGSGNVC